MKFTKDELWLLLHLVDCEQCTMRRMSGEKSHEHISKRLLKNADELKALSQKLKMIGETTT